MLGNPYTPPHSFTHTGKRSARFMLGLCNALPLDASKLQKAGCIPFVSKDINKRTQPGAILPDVQSIFVVGVEYADTPVCDDTCTKALDNERCHRVAELSHIGVGEDYHIRVREILDDVVFCLQDFCSGIGSNITSGDTADSTFPGEQVPLIPELSPQYLEDTQGHKASKNIRLSRKPRNAHENVSELGSIFMRLNEFPMKSITHTGANVLQSYSYREHSNISHTLSYKILVDSPTLDERALALRAGIGFFGKHGLIISEEFGTRFNIGLLLTSLPLQYAENFLQMYGDATGSCTMLQTLRSCPQNCNKCIAACPNQALTASSNGINPLDYTKCISYLTQKKQLTVAEESMLHGQLYGCDICQKVCPFNKHVSWTKVEISPDDWILMTDEEFKEKYANSAIVWRGADILRRNAKLAKRTTNFANP